MYCGAGPPPGHDLSRVRQNRRAIRWACRAGRCGHEPARRTSLCGAITRTVTASWTSSSVLQTSTYPRHPTLWGARASARVRAGSLAENGRASDLDHGGDSGGDPARKGLKCADRAGHLKGHPGNALQSRLVSIAPALFRGCEHASLEPTNAASHRFRPWVPRHPKRAFLARHLSSEQNVLSRS